MPFAATSVTASAFPREGGQAFANVEVRIDRPAGRSPRWFSCSGIWVRRDESDADSFFGHEKSIYLLLVAMEITEQRAQQEKARMAALQAMLAEDRARQRAARDAGRGGVPARRTDQRACASVVGMMGRRGHDPAAGALAEALRAGQSALDNAARGDSAGHRGDADGGEPERSAARRARAVHRRLLAAGISVSWKPQAVLPAINGYPNRLRGMIKALIDNAAEAMNTRGWVERELHADQPQPIGAMVEIAIEDTGPGIPDGSAAQGLRALLHDQEERRGTPGHRAVAAPSRWRSTTAARSRSTRRRRAAAACASSCP